MAKRSGGKSREMPQQRPRKKSPSLANSTSEANAKYRTVSTLQVSIAASVDPIPVVANFSPTADRPYVIERLLTPEEVAAEYLVRQEDLDLQFERARTALKRWLPSLKRTPMYKRAQITGACVRYRTRFGRPVSPLQVVIGVNVQTKRRPEDIPVEEMLPKVKFGVPVKVVEGSFQLLANEARFLRASGAVPKNPLSFTEPVVGGSPIAPPGQPEKFGTVGVVFSTDGTQYFGMTCKHVFAGSKPMDQLTLNSSGDVLSRSIANAEQAEIRHWVHSQTQREETIDCGLVKVVAPSSTAPPIKLPPKGEYWIRGITHDANQAPQASSAVKLFFSSRPVINAMAAFEMYKFGAAYGEVAKGKLRDSDTALFNVGQFSFKNNFTVEHRDGNQRFVTPGDSGSIIALRAKVQGKIVFVAVGILFAALEDNGFVGLACNMSQVLDALNTGIPTSRIISTWALP